MFKNKDFVKGIAVGAVGGAFAEVFILFGIEDALDLFKCSYSGFIQGIRKAISD